MDRILPYLLCSAGYAAVAFALVRVLSRPGPRQPGNPPHLAIALPLALHTWLLYRSIFNGSQMYFGVGDSISVIIWLTVLRGFFHKHAY